jgi:hypothetical protein
MFDVTEQVRACLYLLDSGNANRLTSPPLRFECLLASLRDQYRKYLKKLSTKSGQSASIKIPKWKYADEMSFVRPYLCERDTVTVPTNASFYHSKQHFSLLHLTSMLLLLSFRKRMGLHI